MTDTIGAADDGDIVEFLGAVTDVRRMISNVTLPVARRRGLSERALGIIVLVYAGLDRPGLLVEFLNVLPSTVSSDVNKLVEAGLLRRRLSPADRRVSRLEVTRKGIAAQQESLRQLHAYFRARAAGVSLDELHACIATLRKLSGEPQPSVPNPLRREGTAD
ncbi:MarR family winged helix-turn-helix transcriptional regulator [Nocardia wallacei]|uniref:MarR family winged helix-turn-helix transcriptional regulator n=1 Tax=Nocardia wallacei TaxID=480035 RepID=UPI0024551A4C|nr:MarR family transcriptional regulator [Nocardia wallacei]